MIATKILERKGVIRAFGACLSLAPLFNTLVSLSMQTGIPDRWNMVMFWHIVSTGSVLNNILYAASFVLGLIMLSGSASAWKFALTLLGAHILLQISNLGYNLRLSWVYGLFFLVNVILFFFIADQLVFKQKKSTAPELKPVVPPQPVAVKLAPVPRSGPAPIKDSKSNVMIHFDGFGTWAKLMQISSEGIQVRSLYEPEFEMSSREIELILKNGLHLRTKLARKQDADYFFEFKPLKNEEIQMLNQWIKDRAA
jgi:hypothetical protein